MKSANDWVRWIIGAEPVSDAKDFVWQQHCTACKSVMHKGFCKKVDCKYFNK